jgi:hypothetical protein
VNGFGAKMGTGTWKYFSTFSGNGMKAEYENKHQWQDTLFLTFGCEGKIRMRKRKIRMRKKKNSHEKKAFSCTFPPQTSYDTNS